MALDYGTGVSRTLTAIERQYGTVVWQKGKPPLDSELNLMSQIQWERLSQLVRSVMPSGFLLDPTRTIEDFEFNPNWANLFSLGNPKEPFGIHEGPEHQPIITANVNGWLIPVAGTDTSVEGDIRNIIKLYPPPESDSRVDFVFLEAWQTLVAPNPSTANKPNASSVWKYGNVKHGGTNIVDDIEDPAIGFETTERVQVQYRIRVFGQGVGLGAGVALDVYPDGLDDPNVLGQGTSAAPVGGFQFHNMREKLGDAGLWRAGDGDPSNSLGTVDGYVYAIPICAVFRRNSSVYTAVNGAGNPNQNGAFERTPASKLLADPLEGSRFLSQASLVNALTPADGVGADITLQVSGLNGSGLEDSALVLSSTFLQIGPEIVGISAVDTVNETITIPAGGRGRFGTAIVGHPAGAHVHFFNTRPDGAYADEVRPTDVLDLRHGVNPGDWDYARILEANVASLVRGDLRSTWKQSAPGDSEGPVVHEVDYLLADGNTNVPNHTEALDGPDGIRTIWSDAATIQSDVTLLLDNEAVQDLNQVGLTSPDGFDNNVYWDVAGDFSPTGFMNVGSGAEKPQAFTNGSLVFLHIGGNDGSSGARGTFRDGSTKEVRFVTPREFWKAGYPSADPLTGNQYPVSIRFLGDPSNEPAPVDLFDAGKDLHTGPMYPLRDAHFERPFIVLGGLLHETLRFENVDVDTKLINQTSVGVGSGANVSTVPRNQLEIDLGVDFDGLGVYFNFPEEDVSAVSVPVLGGRSNLYNLMTNRNNFTGTASEVYVVLYGDQDSTQNNGVFRVVGMGTSDGRLGFVEASSNTRIVVEPLSADFTPWDGVAGGFDITTGNTVTVEFRSQHHNADDVSNFPTRVADLCIGITDIAKAKSVSVEYPEDSGTTYDYDLTLPLDAVSGRHYAESKMVLSTTLLYHPGRSAMARVPDDVNRVALRGGAASNSGTYLQQNRTQIDTTFAASSGVPVDEAPFHPAHVQTWNRLSGLGWHAPDAPDYGGNIVGFTEIDRENQTFYDKGSKTLIFRPFRDRAMTLKSYVWAEQFLPDSLIGSLKWVDFSAKDALEIWTGGAGDGKRSGYAVPREHMPRFGRQDIPYYQDTLAGQGLFLEGINHLFLDKADSTEPVFEIIGGTDNQTGGNEVTSFYFITNEPGTDYGHAGTVPAVANKSFIGARKVPIDIASSVNAGAIAIRNDLAQVNSSDFGRGLKGIQLPPYYGPARIYGVYERSNWEARGGDTYAADRITKLADPAINLLREDAVNQTLFILQSGGLDLTDNEDDHTYILPDTAIDVSRVPGFDPASHTFDSFEYVVECSVFGFARGFINKNNFVLVRSHNGQGETRTDYSRELEGVHMCIPSAAGLNDALYVGYNRTVYQGDVFMSRNGATRTTSDYENRYGRLSVSAQHSLKTAIQQYDTNGNFVPELTNSRGFQVLAALDFYTTLGTGKIGGNLFAGTSLDVGYTENHPLAASRLPQDQTDPAWRVLTRAFTEGQKTNPSRAILEVEIADNTALYNLSNNEALAVFSLTTPDKSQRFYAFTDKIIDNGGWTVWADNSGHGWFEIANPEKTVFTRKNLIHRESIEFTPSVVKSKHGYLAAVSAPVAVPAGVPTTGDVSVVVNRGDIDYPAANGWDHPEGSLHFDALVKDGFYHVRALFNGSLLGFDLNEANDFRNVRAYIFDNVMAGVGTVVPIGGTVDSLSFVFEGADPAKENDQLFVIEGPSDAVINNYADLTFRVNVVAVDTLELSIINHSTSLAYDLQSQVFKVAMLQDVDPDNVVRNVFNVSQVPLLFDFGWEAEVTETRREVEAAAETAQNLADAINSSTKLKSNFTARTDGTRVVTIESIPTGAEGNLSRGQIGDHNSINANKAAFVTDPLPSFTLPTKPLYELVKVRVPSGNELRTRQLGRGYFYGGEDLPMNAGPGSSQLRLTGMTERLPLGALLQDSDFLCENPNGDVASAMQTFPANQRPLQNLLPLTQGGEEYSRFMGAPGELIGLSDGAIAVDGFLAWTTDTPTGSKKFRIYRGGGAAYMLGGNNPGGPIDWVSYSFPKSQQPVLKGGILSCKALLVRNFYEEAFSSPYTTTQGDELQLLIITRGMLGNWYTTQDGITLEGVISPAGYGEGYAAADRYRCQGRPLIKGYTRQEPNPSDVTLAVYDESTRKKLSDAAAEETKKGGG